MRHLLGGSSVLIGIIVLMLTGWDILQSFNPAYEPTTILSWAGHGPIQILWGSYTIAALFLIWFGSRKNSELRIVPPGIGIDDISQAH